MKLRVALRLVRPHEWMGGVNYLLNLARVLQQWNTEVEPVIFAPPGTDSAIAERVQHAVGAPPLPLRDRSYKDDAAAVFGHNDHDSLTAFRDARIDVVFESTGYYGARPQIPTLAWLQDFQHRSLPGFFSRKQWATREARNRLILANRTDVVLSSQAANSDLRAYYPGAECTVHVIRFAVQPEQLVTFDQGEEVRKRLCLPENFIFFPGQFWAHKNHKFVAGALAAIEGPRPTVVAAGPTRDLRAPKNLHHLIDQIEEHSLWQHYRLLGPLPYRDILGLARRADAILNPSLFEGWSTTVEEAKALGTPLVLSSLPVHKEQAGSSGIFFDPHDATDGARALSQVQPRRDIFSHAELTQRNEAAQLRFSDEFGLAVKAAWGRVH